MTGSGRSEEVRGDFCRMGFRMRYHLLCSGWAPPVKLFTGLWPESINPAGGLKLDRARLLPRAIQFQFIISRYFLVRVKIGFLFRRSLLFIVNKAPQSIRLHRSHLRGVKAAPMELDAWMIGIL